MHFFSFSTTRVKRSTWNQHIFFVNVRFLNIDINNYHEETELGTNPSLTLAQTLTLYTLVSAVSAILLPVVITTSQNLILRT